MNHTSMYIRSQPKPAKQGHCDSACPVCGGLKCLCRPRFFAGQLLTDEDLNRLDQYIIGKNRLHNRYLHGWGVVCGMDVVCHPCKEEVTVRPGYALSPCGDDIVVCDDAHVDICRLIRDCRDQARRQRQCEPYDYGGDDRCKDPEEEWILSICYDEKATRGITALRGGGCSCGGNCGGSGGGSCGCGGTGSKSNGGKRNGGQCSCGGSSYNGGHSHAQVSSRTTKSSLTTAQCEPTVICEGFHFAIQKKPVPAKSARQSQGELVDRFTCCVMALAEAMPPAPNSENRADWKRWCCNLKDALRNFFAESGIYNCELDEKLASIYCPEPNDGESLDEYMARVISSVVDFAFIAAEYLRYCLCSALLPPCPGPEDDNCVPLAMVTVRQSDCHIVRICVLEARKMAVTWPAIGYWLSPLQLDRILQPFIDAFCCRVPDRDRNEWSQRVGLFRESANYRAAYQSKNYYGSSADLRSIFTHALNRQDQPIEAANFALDMFGALDQNGKPFLRNIERQYPLQSLLANQLVVPLARVVATGVGKPDIEEETTETPGDFAAMAEEVSALREVVLRQQEMLEELRRRMDG